MWDNNQHCISFAFSYLFHLKNHFYRRFLDPDGTVYLGEITGGSTVCFQTNQHVPHKHISRTITELNIAFLQMGKGKITFPANEEEWEREDEDLKEVEKASITITIAITITISITRLRGLPTWCDQRSSSSTSALWSYYSSLLDLCLWQFLAGG